MGAWQSEMLEVDKGVWVAVVQFAFDVESNEQEKSLGRHIH